MQVIRVTSWGDPGYLCHHCASELEPPFVIVDFNNESPDVFLCESCSEELKDAL